MRQLMGGLEVFVLLEQEFMRQGLPKDAKLLEQMRQLMRGLGVVEQELTRQTPAKDALLLEQEQLRLLIVERVGGVGPSLLLLQQELARL